MVPHTLCWRPSFNSFINGVGMEYTMKYPILQISEIVKCQADKDKLQDKGNSQGSVDEQKPDK